MPRRLQPLTLLLPHLVFKNGLLKPFGELRVLWCMSHPFSLHGQAMPNPNVLLCLASLCTRHMNLHFVTLLTKVPFHSPAISALPLVRISMKHFNSVYKCSFSASGPSVELMNLFYEKYQLYQRGPQLAVTFALPYPYNRQQWFSKWGPLTHIIGII